MVMPLCYEFASQSDYTMLEQINFKKLLIMLVWTKNTNIKFNFIFGKNAEVLQHRPTPHLPSYTNYMATYSAYIPSSHEC